MIRKQARDLCGRDIGRKVDATSRGIRRIGELVSITHGRDWTTITFSSLYQMHIQPTETVEVSGSEANPGNR